MEQLTDQQINRFTREGFVAIEDAFSKEIAEECRAILWKATGCDPNDPASWTQPVIRVGEMKLPPFVKAANTPVLHRAFDQLVGTGNWVPKQTLGSFPIRFPSAHVAQDTGWHVDASFAGEDSRDYASWRINLHSTGRALLMLFLFSDVSEKDAPTRIRCGSHLDVARILAPSGKAGLSFMELAQRLHSLPEREQVLATGKAGTVYLCHPFLVHAAQDHQGTAPKFMAQPALSAKKDFDLSPGNERCPVAEAISYAISFRAEQ